MCAKVKSLCNTPETNIILYINFISIKKKACGEGKNPAHHIWTHLLRITHKDSTTWPQFAFLASSPAMFSSAKLTAFLSKYLVHVLCAQFSAEFSAKNCPFLYCLPRKLLLSFKTQISTPETNIIL